MGASRLIAWFQDRLLTAERLRDAAVAARVSAEDDRRVPDEQRAAAVEARVSAEDARRHSNGERAEADRRVVEVERLLAASEELSHQLQQALDSRIVIEQAKGFLAARYSVTTDAAFEAMRGHARDNNRTMRDVAAKVMAVMTTVGL